jgi:hypothetical protein
MRRKDPHDDVIPLRKRTGRAPAPPIPTLDELQRGQSWWWVHCSGTDCWHAAPIALAPLVIRWGFGVSSDRLRHRARCTKCGHVGATLIAPSRDGLNDSQPFPTPYVALVAPLPRPISPRP